MKIKRPSFAILAAVSCFGMALSGCNLFGGKGGKEEEKEDINVKPTFDGELERDEEGNIIGYEYVNLGKLMDALKKEGTEKAEALEKACGKYGRFDEAVKKIDPREE